MGFGIKNTPSSDGTLKNNFNADRAPLASDNNAEGYAAGSVWVYNAVTYTCVSITSGVAVWRSEASTYYADDWAAAVTWLLTGDHAGWFVVLANGNGAPDPSVGEFEGTSAARTASSVISDGGVATLQVVSSSVTKYKVKCQARTVTNPVIKAIYNASTTTAQAFSAGGAGYYIWTALPSGAFAGMTANAVCYCNSSGVWATFQTYACAPNSLLVGSGAAQYEIFKNAGAWLRGVSLASASIYGYAFSNGHAQGYWKTANNTGAVVRSKNVTPTAGGWAEVTITQAGTYRVSGGCGGYANNAGPFHVVLYKNGSAISADMKIHLAAGTSGEPVAATQLECSVGDVLNMQILHEAANGGITGWYFDVQQMPSIALIAL